MAGCDRLVLQAERSSKIAIERSTTMAGPIRYESIQEPLDDEERELMDPETWDWESAEVLPGTVYDGVGLRVEFEWNSFQILAVLAERENVTPAELVQRIVLERLAAERLPQDASVGYAERA
jgi:hypothetical protein